MGMFLGKISVETPNYSVLEKGAKYVIREYPPSIVAEVSYDPSSVGGRDGGFTILAAYIGAFGSPANSAPSGTSESGAQSIAMTAPVITISSEAIAMTAPVVTKEESVAGDSEKKLTTMQFILPAKYTMETVPKPTDERVRVRETSSRTMAAITFSGVANEALTQKKFIALRNALQEEKAGYKIAGEHILARYNPPFTPWFLRTNEVLVPVEKE